MREGSVTSRKAVERCIRKISDYQFDKGVQGYDGEAWTLSIIKEIGDLYICMKHLTISVRATHMI